MTVTFSVTELDFGRQLVGTTSASRPITVQNLGSAPVTLSAANFTFGHSTYVPGTTQSSVTFTPSAAEVYTRQVGGAPGLTLRGKGAKISIEPALLAFGNQPVGSSETKFFDVTFEAPDATAASLTSLSGAFSIATTTVAPSASSKKIAVTFKPTAAGALGPISVTLTPDAPIAGTATATMAAVSGTGVTTSAEELRQEEGGDYVHTSGSDERYEPGGQYWSPGVTPPTSGKYWEIELDHTASTDPGKKMNSYLRLGSFEANPKLTSPTVRNDASDRNDKRGHDLASMIVGFRDDTRERRGGANSTFDTVAKRQEESAKLHFRGGWRDHSDGNRISTTRGDKIEVIQGNYHMVVLGRFDDRGSGARIETSGGHVAGDTETQTPGAVMEIRYNTELYGGTWRVVQETVKGDSINRYHGDVESYYYGNKQWNEVGAETVGVPIEGSTTIGEGSTIGSGWASQTTGSDARLLKANPDITSKTWAKKIETYVGSATTPVPHIYSLTYAERIESITLAKSVVSTTEAASVLSQTGGASIVSLNTALGDIVSVNTAIVANIQINASLLALTLNAVAAQADFKYGTYFSYGTNKTYVHGNSTTIEGGQEVVSMTQNRLDGITNDINSTNNRISMSNNLVSAAVQSLVEHDYSVGATRAFVFAETLVGV